MVRNGTPGRDAILAGLDTQPIGPINSETKEIFLGVSDDHCRRYD